MSRYDNLFRLIDEHECTTIVEIGTFRGDHAIQMIKCAQKYGSVTYYGFDLFEDMTQEVYTAELSKGPVGGFHSVDIRMKLNMTGANIHLIKGNTRKTLPEFIIGDLPHIDFIFLDGGHSLETIESDWNCVKELMGEKTIVVFDDYFTNREDTGCKPLVDSIDRSEYDVQHLEPTQYYRETDLNIRVIQVTLK